MEWPPNVPIADYLDRSFDRIDQLAREFANSRRIRISDADAFASDLIVNILKKEFEFRSRATRRAKQHKLAKLDEFENEEHWDATFKLYLRFLQKSSIRKKKKEPTMQEILEHEVPVGDENIDQILGADELDWVRNKLEDKERQLFDLIRGGKTIEQAAAVLKIHRSVVSRRRKQLLGRIRRLLT